MPSNAIAGWFQIGWSTDLQVGDVRQLRYFGEDLVAYRDTTGTVRLAEAYCRHLGANLAVGGCVVDDGIQCPFHGWVWRPDGTNASIPYEKRTSRVRLRVWPVVELFGVLFAWHDPAGRAPLFDLPTEWADIAPHLAGRTFHETGPATQSLFPGTTIHPEMVIENAVDPAHFRFVHHTPQAPTVLRQENTDHTWFAKVGFGRRWEDGVDRPDDQVGTLQLKFWGTAVGFNAQTDRERVMIILIATTPIDDTRSDVFGTYWPEMLPDDQATGRHQSYIDDAKLALPDDIAIWNHQKFLERPALTTSEAGGFRRIREWTQKYYPDAGAEPLAHLRGRKATVAG
ncbi:Rieske 2Fe-2S domain-containing protein [Cryptosporangium aurantiacum]|uniref:cholesterol 7-desaturase n=1 Tax=Cryptosporangium aurantiacum TaxID=134849 RepID=A0A1M7PGC9_9ACTN|nr:Rieske 2Fe-2S domain-containing protein [Cryptosporangium aurantiacum]SHN16121.1 Phenylpropionate dioxygenase, large terminal subunit [Cryptosporangium aurantiacum]